MSLAVLLIPLTLNAQSDNFDSGALSSAWTKYQFFPQSYTFPTVGNGKGLRIQANPAPGAAPAAAALSQTNQYTDFYVAVDVVNWAVEDQAVVLLGRWVPGGTAGLAEGTGMIINYDVAQDGDHAGDRKGGQLQINAVFPGFGTSTKAAADITFEPGQSYRLILKAVGTLYTAQAYDLNDLTKPLVTIQTDDATYASGLCGFLSFSRDGTAGTTDVTIDNYFAAAADPNPATPPALAHSIAGTPVVDTRVPAARWANFHNPAAGVSFTARTYAVDVINSSVTRLRLNGIDLSSQLTLSANGNAITGSLPGSALSPNALYQGQIELARQEIQKGLTLDPTQRLLRTSLGYLDFRQGDYANAITTLESVLQEDTSLRLVYPTLALCYLAAGQRAEAAAMITEGTLSSADADGEMAYRLATYFALDGDATEALHWLRKAIYLGNENYPWFGSNPAWAKLRDNEDLVKVMARLKKTHRQNQQRWQQLIGSGVQTRRLLSTQ